MMKPGGARLANALELRFENHDFRRNNRSKCRIQSDHLYGIDRSRSTNS